MLVTAGSMGEDKIVSIGEVPKRRGMIKRATWAIWDKVCQIVRIGSAGIVMPGGRDPQLRVMSGVGDGGYARRASKMSWN